MGKQVRFYSLQQDEKDFWKFVSSIPESSRLSTQSSIKQISSFIVNWDTELPNKNFRQYNIGKGNLNRLNIHLREGSYKYYSETELRYVDTGERFFWFDPNAPFVRFDSSVLNDDEKLRQGRIWADFYMLQGDQFVYKGDEFKELYETLAAWIRKNFKKIKGVDGYFGKEALAWYQNGGKLFP